MWLVTKGNVQMGMVVDYWDPYVRGIGLGLRRKLGLVDVRLDIAATDPGSSAMNPSSGGLAFPRANLAFAVASDED